MTSGTSLRPNRNRYGAGAGNRTKGVFYRKSLVWLLLTASIPGLITGLCIYFFSVHQLEEELSALHQSQIDERIQNVDDQLSYLELDLSHWAFSPRFGYSLQHLDFIYQFQETRDISKSLVVMQGSHPLIHEVELYVDREVPVVFKTEHYRIYDPDTTEGYRSLLDDPRRVYWLEHAEAASGGGEEAAEHAVSSPEYPLVLVHKVPGESSAPFGVLTVSIKRDKLINLLRTMTPYNEGVTFLLNARGQTLISDNPAEAGLEQALKERITPGHDKRGTFVMAHEGTSYSVSYGSLHRIDSEWTYVSASPMSSITSPIVALSKIIVAISAASLLLALALSWLVSLRMYSPVARLLRALHPELSPQQGQDEFHAIEMAWRETAVESVELQKKLRSQQPLLREGFLLQLLQGHLLSYSEHDLRERMRRLGWQVDHHWFVLMQIRLTGMDRMDVPMTSDDESLVTFAAYNIAEELASSRFEQFHAMNFHNLSVGLFVIAPDHVDIARELRDMSDDVTAAVNRLLRMQVTVAVSRAETDVKRMRAVMLELERAAGFRQFVNRNQVIELSEFAEDIDDAAAAYPFELEMDLLGALRSGEGPMAEKLLERFVEEAVDKGGTELQIQQNMLQLLGSIQHMMLESGINPARLYGGENRFERLSRMKEPGMMVRWMKEKVIFPYLYEREARAGVQQKQVIDATIQYIKSRYKEDISLESCADLAGMSTYALSRLFKSVTGINFIDYLTGLRIAKAKELLRGTDMKINDVAEAVGYQQRYFNRIFKKLVGITPSEYRDSGG